MLMRKKNRNIPGEYSILLTTIKVIKTQESLRNCHRQEEPKEM
jgi:hypothetical protein